MVDMLQSKMRPNVLYITVSQHDLGVYKGAKGSTFPQMRNLFVLSSGGYGHVALPLLKQPEKPLVEAPSAHVFSEILRVLHRKDWKDILQNSTLAFSPRGFGRSSFRTIELLQMGRVPVYLYDDIPWLFYPELWEKEIVGFQSQIKDLQKKLDHIAELGPDHLKNMENRILSMRQSHFSYEGVINQISRWVLKIPELFKHVLTKTMCSHHPTL
eukprot:Skav235823  [mRNA]  locus=scaffold1931:25853:27147:- [translate_table: standard]